MSSEISEKRVMNYVAGVAAIAGGAAAANGAIVAYEGPAIPFNKVTKGAVVDFNRDGISDYQIYADHEKEDGTGNRLPNKDYIDLKRGDDTDNLAATNAFVIRLGDADATKNDRVDALTAGTLIGPDSPISVYFPFPQPGSSDRNLLDERPVDPGKGVTTPEGNFTRDNVVGNPDYLGVRFKIGGTGQDYYGWIGVDVTNADDLTGVVTGYAYEDTGAAIVAGDAGVVPEPAAMSAVAVGAMALLRRRSR